MFESFELNRVRKPEGSNPQGSFGAVSRSHVMNQFCRESTCDNLGVGNLAGEVQKRVLADALSHLRDSSCAGVLLPLDQYEWFGDLGNVPAQVVIRVPYIEEGLLLLFRRADWERCGGFPEEAGPLVGLTHRLAAFGHIRIDCSAAPVAQPAVPFEPPPLSPGRTGPTPTGLADFDPCQIGDVRSAADATAVRAGLWQLHGQLEESHQDAQSVEGLGHRRAGDYWHAVMHRREGDFGNAKYWFHRVGSHPLMAELSRRAHRILLGAKFVGERWRAELGCPQRWDPLAFVDLCAAAEADAGSPLWHAACRIQWQEMILLLGATCRDAYGD
jgi:hypothetical protein